MHSRHFSKTDVIEIWSIVCPKRLISMSPTMVSFLRRKAVDFVMAFWETNDFTSIASSVLSKIMSVSKVSELKKMC